VAKGAGGMIVIPRAVIENCYLESTKETAAASRWRGHQKFPVQTAKSKIFRAPRGQRNGTFE